MMRNSWNEDIAHIKSARAYSEALERARENPGAFLRKKDQMLNTNKNVGKASSSGAVCAKVARDANAAKARAVTRRERILAKSERCATPSNADLLRAPRSISSPNPFALYTTNAGVPHLSADDERRRRDAGPSARSTRTSSTSRGPSIHHYESSGTGAG